MQTDSIFLTPPSGQTASTSSCLDIAIVKLLDILCHYSGAYFDSQRLYVSEAELKQLAVAVIETAAAKLEGRTLAGYLLQVRVKQDSVERID